MNKVIPLKEGVFMMSGDYKSFRVRVDPAIKPEDRHLYRSFPLKDWFFNAPSEDELIKGIKGVFDEADLEYTISVEEIIDFKHLGYQKYRCQFTDGRWEEN